ncbi:MAG: hypothetical protein ABFE01_04455 [Phycisphaerales bacterium]
MFSKPKLAKPRNAREKSKVNAELKKKYPDMVNKTGAWGKAKANGLTGVNAEQYKLLSKDDKAEIDRILGRK